MLNLKQISIVRGVPTTGKTTFISEAVKHGFSPIDTDWLIFNPLVRSYMDATHPKIRFPQEIAKSPFLRDIIYSQALTEALTYWYCDAKVIILTNLVGPVCDRVMETFQVTKDDQAYFYRPIQDVYELDVARQEKKGKDPHFTMEMLENWGAEWEKMARSFKNSILLKKDEGISTYFFDGDVDLDQAKVAETKLEASFRDRVKDAMSITLVSNL